MRVTFATSYAKTLQNLNSSSESISKLSTMLTTGVSLLSASDDPYAWSEALDVKQGLRELDTIDDNLTLAVGWNETTYSALEQMYDLLVDAQSTATALDSTSTDTELQAAADTIGELLEQAMEITNTQYNGSYVFSGWGITTDGSGNMVCSASSPPFDSSYNYQGSTDDLLVRTSTSRTQAINLNGEEVFVFEDPNSGASVNMLELLSDLKTNIESAITSGDLTAVTDSLELLETAEQHITSKESLVGTQLNSLENQQTVLADLTLSEEDRYADLTEADYTAVATELAQKQVLYEAAMQVTSMLSDLNLVDYLS